MARVLRNLSGQAAKGGIKFAINYEEGTERSPLLGDTTRDSRTWARSALSESEYEYRTRVGIWRLLRIFKEFGVTYSVPVIRWVVKPGSRKEIEIGDG